MSGAPSVPLAIAAYFVPSGVAKFGLFATAIACAVLSSYWIWKIEREARMHAEATLKEALETPLCIIFDTNNPNNRFWSMEPVKDRNGSTSAGSFWEYRASIKNESIRTARNVKVTTQVTGAMSQRPKLSHFDLDKQYLVDLNPNEETLALIIQWPIPINPPGILTRHTYEIEMTASADDMQSTKAVFDFYHNRTPMIALRGE